MVDQKKTGRKAREGIAMKNKTIKGKYISILLLCVLMMLGFVFATTRTSYAAGFSAKLPVKQIFESYSGSDGVLGGKFEYTLTPVNSEKALEGFTLTGNEQKDITYSFEKAGVYQYTLKAVKGTEKGYTWDTKAYIVRFYIGNKSITVTIEDKATGEKVDLAEFTHSYAPDIVSVDPPVIKKIDGDNPPKASEFKFKLTADDSSNPMPAGSANGEKTLTIKGSGKGEFGTWKYNHVGSYTYTVTEVNTKEDGYTYDTTQYTFTDTVTDNGGKLEVSREISKGDGKSFVFTNTYKAPEKPVPPTPTPPVDTGDSSSIILFAVLFFSALAGLALAFRKRV